MAGKTYRCHECGKRRVGVTVVGGRDLCPACADAVAREGWPVHQPEAHDAPVPGRVWFSACEPQDYDSERGYYGRAGVVDPETGLCTSCGRPACRTCGRENCPEHP